MAKKFFGVTVVDQKACMIPKVSGLRSCVAEGWEGVSVIPNDKMFDVEGCKVIKGKVESIDKADKSIIMVGGDRVKYDYLVIATGGLSYSPADPPETCTTAEECIQHFKNIQAEVKEAKHILVVGGGTVGCELVGELKHYQNHCKVTICDSGSELCKGISSSVSAKILKLCEDDNVHVMFNERVKSQQGEGEGLDLSNLLVSKFVKPKDGKVNLTSNKTLTDIDLVFWCIGFSPSTSLMRASGMEDKLEANGRIKVNEYLQVQGETNIFAIGDCNNVDETKMAASAQSNAAKKMFIPEGNADGVFHNLIAMATKGNMVPYKSKWNPSPLVVVSYGPSKGAAKGVPQMVVSMKAKTLRYEDAWKNFNQQPPKTPVTKVAVG
eukprot:GHVN01099826.1.p1 GENE.GHVN01099826.1~~GHVN01099826.1.p1  ORF type:complete len:429 (+),score=65.14 GHVN01099826.1:149-1288(+)